MKKIIPLFLALILLCGCNRVPSSPDSGSSSSGIESLDGSSSDTELVPPEADFSSAEGMFTDRDLRSEYSVSESVYVRLNGATASCDSRAVNISGSTVTITAEGTYVISGSLDSGMIVINAPDTAKIQLVLDGASVTSETSAALYVLEADKVFVTLSEGSHNTLSNGGSFVSIDENDIDAAVFSKQDITFNGTGSLTVDSPAGHGIVSKDDLVFVSGRYTVNAVSHAVDANDSVRILNADLSLTAGKDGIHAENGDDASLGFVYIRGGNFNVISDGDGISALAYMQIEGGAFNITSGGGSENAPQQPPQMGGFMGGMGGMGGRPGDRGQGSSSFQSDDGISAKAIKSTGSMLITNGTFILDSSDDAVHSNASITLNGGSFDISTGDDGFHADDTLTLNGGTIGITESYEGLEGLHIFVNGGDISLVASDDGLNAAGGTDSSGYGGNRGNDMFGGRGGMGGMGGSSNGSITIAGGNLYVKASGDGIDANGTLSITGGYTVVCGPTQGDTATLDYDKSAVISGGTFIGTGASGMAQTFSDSEQGVIAVSVGNQSAGTQITLTDKSGNTVISYAPDLSFGVVILSSPDMVKGEPYTITVGSASGTFEAS